MRKLGNTTTSITFSFYILHLPYTLQSNNKWCTTPPDTEKNQLHIACAVLESKSNHYYYYYCLWYKTNTYSSDVSFLTVASPIHPLLP